MPGLHLLPLNNVYFDLPSNTVVETKALFTHTHTHTHTHTS